MYEFYFKITGSPVDLLELFRYNFMHFPASLSASGIRRKISKPTYFGEFWKIRRENLHFEEFRQEIILSVCANIKSAKPSTTATPHANYSHRTNRKSTNLPNNMVERLELSANFFTGSALDGSSLLQELEGCFKKSKKTAI
jgi:hypothetical protein